MPIVFQGLEDPFNLRSASSALAQAMMQRNVMDRQEESLLGKEKRAEQRTIDAEKRAQALKKQYGEVLGDALGIAQDPSLPSMQRMGALQSYISKTGDTSVLPLLKSLSQEAQTNQLLESLGIRPPGQQGQSALRDTLQSSSSSPQAAAVRATQVSPSQVQDSSIMGDYAPQNTSRETGLPSLTPQQRVAAAGIPQLKPVADALAREEEMGQRRFESERTYHSQLSTPFLKGIDSERDNLRKQNFALRELDTAISEGNTGGFSLNNISRVFNRPELLTASGAQLAGAAKELLIANLGSISGRPNMFLEQQFTAALPELGKSPQANAVLAESLRANIALSQAKHEIADRISNEDMQKYGYVKSDISSRVERELKPLAEKVDNKAAFRVREIVETEKGDKVLRQEANKKVPQGTPLTHKMARILYEKHKTPEKVMENALKLGYEIFGEDEIEEFKRAR